MIEVDETFFSLYEKHRNFDLTKQPLERAKLLTRLIDLAKIRVDLPLILPRRIGNETHWYFLARSPQQSRLLRDQIRAFLAPPYSNFDGGRGIFIEDDDFDSSVQMLFGDSAIKLTVGSNRTERDAVNMAIAMLIDLLEQMPHSLFELTRPLRRILSDFEWSLELQNVEESRRLLEEIALVGRLSQENILFLGVRRLAALGMWGDLLEIDGLEDMLYLRMPQGVVYAVIRAVDHEILNIEDEDEKYRRLNDGKFSALGSLRISDTGTVPNDVLAGFKRLRGCLGLGQPSDQRTDGDTFAKEPPDANFIGEPVLPSSEVSDSGTVSHNIEHLIALGDYVQALDKCKLLAPSLHRAGLLLKICFEDRSPDIIRIVLEESLLWPESLKDEIQDNRLLNGFFQWLQTQAIDGVVLDSVFVWLDFLQSNVSDQRLQELFEDNYELWLTKLEDKDSIMKLATAIEEASLGEKSHVLRRNLAFMHRVATSYGGVEGIKVLEASFNALALEDSLSVTELDVLRSLAESILEEAVSDVRQRVLTETRKIWERIANPMRLPWLLDIVSAIRATAGPDDAHSRKAVQSMASLVSSFMPASVEPDLFPLVRLFLSDALDLDACMHVFSISPGEEIVANSLESLLGKKVGIYTTENRRALRIQDALKKIVDCDVRLNHDLQCTGQLTAIAKNCDIVVVLTNAATHAATGCIADHRGDGPTLLIHATGVSTVLAKIGEYLNLTAGSE